MERTTEHRERPFSLTMGEMVGLSVACFLRGGRATPAGKGWGMNGPDAWGTHFDAVLRMAYL